MQTRGGCQWVLGEWKETSGEGDLCDPGWLHFYKHPLLAVLLNPLHANISHPRLFCVAAEGRTLNDYGLKVGYTKARLIEEVPLPGVTTKQRVMFAILCARTVFFDKIWIAWASAWTLGENRTEAAAEAAAWAAMEAARTAAGKLDLIALAIAAMEVEK